MSHIKEQMFEKVILQTGTKWTIALFIKFYGKVWVSFVLAHEKAFFSKRVHFQGNGKSIGSSKNGTRDFQNSPTFLRDRHTFMWQITRNFKRFQYFNFETNFQKTKNFFRKLEYCFLIESNEIENATFSYKTAPLKANFKTNRIGSKNEPITKNRFLPVTNLIFWKFCFSWKV